MVEKKTDAIDRIAIDHIVKLLDRLVVERLRLFRLKRAIDAYAQTVDSQLLECISRGGSRAWGKDCSSMLGKRLEVRGSGDAAGVYPVSEWTRPGTSQ